MWVQPEITQKLYVALWAAFLASCFFPYRLVGLAVGKGGKKRPPTWETVKGSVTQGGGMGQNSRPLSAWMYPLLSPQASMLASSFS